MRVRRRAKLGAPRTHLVIQMREARPARLFTWESGVGPRPDETREGRKPGCYVAAMECRPVVRPRFGRLLALAVLTASGSAHAEGSSPAMDLRWSAPDECPTRERVLSDIQAIVGGSERVRHEVSAVATVGHEGARWSAAVWIRTPDGAGMRSFEAGSCTALAHAVSLIVALAASERPVSDEAPSGPSVDATKSSGGETSGAGPAEKSAPAERPRSEMPSVHFGPPRPSGATGPQPSRAKVAGHSRFAIAAGLRADSGMLPRPSAGVGLSAAWLVLWPAWLVRAEAVGSYWPPRRQTAPGAPSEGGDFSLFTFGVRACIAARVGRFEVGPCAGGEVDAEWASAFGETTNPGGHAAWGAISAEGSGSVSFSRGFLLRLDLGIAAPFARPDFVIDVPAPTSPIGLHRPASVAGRGFLGLEARFF